MLLFSCVPETTTALIHENLNLVEALNTPTSGEENLRKTTERNYFERFENSLLSVKSDPDYEGPDPAFYPVTGSGNS